MSNKKHATSRADATDMSRARTRSQTRGGASVDASSSSSPSSSVNADAGANANANGNGEADTGANVDASTSVSAVVPAAALSESEISTIIATVHVTSEQKAALDAHMSSVMANAVSQADEHARNSHAATLESHAATNEALLQDVSDAQTALAAATRSAAVAQSDAQARIDAAEAEMAAMRLQLRASAEAVSLAQQTSEASRVVREAADRVTADAASALREDAQRATAEAQRVVALLADERASSARLQASGVEERARLVSAVQTAHAERDRAARADVLARDKERLAYQLLAAQAQAAQAQAAQALAAQAQAAREQAAQAQTAHLTTTVAMSQLQLAALSTASRDAAPAADIVSASSGALVSASASALAPAPTPASVVPAIVSRTQLFGVGPGEAEKRQKIVLKLRRHFNDNIMSDPHGSMGMTWQQYEASLPADLATLTALNKRVCMNRRNTTYRLLRLARVSAAMDARSVLADAYAERIDATTLSASVVHHARKDALRGGTGATAVGAGVGVRASEAEAEAETETETETETESESESARASEDRTESESDNESHVRSFRFSAAGSHTRRTKRHMRTLDRLYQEYAAACAGASAFCVGIETFLPLLKPDDEKIYCAFKAYLVRAAQAVRTTGGWAPTSPPEASTTRGDSSSDPSPPPQPPPMLSTVEHLAATGATCSNTTCASLDEPRVACMETAACGGLCARRYCDEHCMRENRARHVCVRHVAYA